MKNKNEYLSEFDWYRSRSINAPFDSMLNNKIACNEVLRHHISVPAIDFVKNKGRLVSLTDISKSVKPEAVLEALRDAQTYFLKPLAAGKGKGVHRLDFEDGKYVLDRKPVDDQTILNLIDTLDGWLLTHGVQQHPILAEIYAETTNTLRMITVRNQDGDAELLFSVLRVGTAKTVPVDNGSRGGLVAHVDLETGLLSQARTLWSNDEFDVHPDSGTMIQGTVLPNWEQTCKSVLELADSLPYLQFVAWDVLLTEDGPVVIEANTSSGVNIIQVWGPQRSGKLGDFYRQHGVLS
ncbi:sugar-transfer associated ATP-grasp domain-containing protein [Glutamicibacter uratoxydans]|uniref:sugar-transfer associated ATP-grasp domain-containing protein n=1 Tax=Glutamicibacter uratoxydans TaxID=43667 RepID=UPI001142CDD7|nr:sugar-transfer associated ATP-grasp domain-containing protein [Glutamicibacter uratoxydans]